MILGLCLLAGPVAIAQHSVARQWNEVLLEAIRGDFARPTVHARNLWHTSVAMYDSWAVYDNTAQPYLLGAVHGDFFAPLESFPAPNDPQAATEEALSYAMYRILLHRFGVSPGEFETRQNITNLFNELGYDATFTSTDYQTGNPAAMGNYIAQQIVDFGLQDNSNEFNLYENRFYQPVNDPLNPVLPGAGTVADPNRWQPLEFDEFIDQSGNVISEQPPFLSPEWGIVDNFALKAEDLTTYERDGFEYRVYHDPGAPPYLDVANDPVMSDQYKRGFALVAIWASHLDPTDGVTLDISPNAIGNLSPSDLPDAFGDYELFYDMFEGGDPSTGHSMNPVTGQPYPPQVVPRGDYGRVLAEFWADGPDSETPPGHWFTILNTVSDHPQLEKRFKGQGAVLSDLEWDIKSYFALGGAMHDAAVAAWGVKGWYDYVRPVSAIRYMASLGQSTDPNAPSYNENGIPLFDGLIELVDVDDPLAGPNIEHVGKVKLYTWKGPEFIADPDNDDPGRELVALPAPLICNAAVCRVRIGPLYLLARGSRGADGLYGQCVFPWWGGRV